MKIKTDFDELEIPKAVLDRLDNYLRSRRMKPISEMDDENTLKDMLWEFYDQAKQEGIISKEEVEFWYGFQTGFMPAEGGYPINEEISFVDGDTKYTVLVFGHAGDYTYIDHLVYKESFSSSEAGS